MGIKIKNKNIDENHKGKRFGCVSITDKSTIVTSRLFDFIISLNFFFSFSGIFIYLFSLKK
jgi:hypothetical protein